MNESTKTKKALRGSLFALFLCIVLLIGTTFAWFADTASTGVNKIQAGNLDVGLQYSKDMNTWVDATGKTDLFDANAQWEPGHTEVVYLKVTNNGSLALKYQLGTNLIENHKGTNQAGGEIDLTQYLKFGVANVTSKYETRDAAREAVEDTSIDFGDLYTESNQLNTKNASQTVAMVVYMPETVGNEANHIGTEVPYVDFGVKVVATQAPYENDSFDDQYDANAPLNFTSVGTTEELKAAFANAKAGEDVNVSLTGDVEISDATLMVADENTPNVGDIYIQGNGHTITNSNDSARCIQIAKFTSDRKITISGAKIVSESTATDNSERRGVQIFSVNNATINLNNCDIEMKSKDYSYPVKIGGTSENLTINITGCKLTGANCIENYGKNCTINITNCVFNSNYAPHATYCGNGIQDKNGTNNTYNIKNTTFNGTNAQPWQANATTTINDKGGNVYNTTRTTE